MALVGVEGVVVEVQADLEPGVAAFTLVGLPDKSLVESRDRVRAAVVFPVKLMCSDLRCLDGRLVRRSREPSDRTTVDAWLRTSVSRDRSPAWRAGRTSLKPRAQFGMLFSRECETRSTKFLRVS